MRPLRQPIHALAVTALSPGAVTVSAHHGPDARGIIWRSSDAVPD